MATQTRDTQAAMTPQRALVLLKEGNRRFAEGRMLQRDPAAQVAQTRAGQYPFAVVLGCIDSRVPPELVFDQGIGDIFSVRIAGNIVTGPVLGSLEFACKLAGAKLIVVLGHTNCGAVMGTIDGVEMGDLTMLLEHIEPAVAAADAPGGRTSENSALVEAAAARNVAVAVEAIKQRSPVLNQMEQTGEIDIVGAMYDVTTGRVTFGI